MCIDRIYTPKAQHLYNIGTAGGHYIEVEANNRTSAAAKARKAGYSVHWVNMVG